MQGVKINWINTSSLKFLLKNTATLKRVVFPILAFFFAYPYTFSMGVPPSREQYRMYSVSSPESWVIMIAFWWHWMQCLNTAWSLSWHCTLGSVYKIKKEDITWKLQAVTRLQNNVTLHHNNMLHDLFSFCLNPIFFGIQCMIGAFSYFTTQPSGVKGVVTCRP